MKIIDCFIFYNELELLESRLEELYDIVDFFILVEGVLTFTGNSKPLFYKENKNRFHKYNDKIIHLIVEDFPSTNNPWDREHYQRRYIHQGIKQLSLCPEDIIIISDVDEIPNGEIISNVKKNNYVLDYKYIYSLVMNIYYYSLEWTSNRKWYHVKILTFNKYSTIDDPEKIRFCPYIPIEMGGWHISYYGDYNFIVNKLESYSEQQTNTSIFKDESFLNNCISNGILYFNNEKLIRNIDKTYLPKFFKPR